MVVCCEEKRKRKRKRPFLCVEVFVGNEERGLLRLSSVVATLFKLFV